MAFCLQDMYLQLRFSPEAAMLLVKEQGLDSPDGLRLLKDKIVDDICNVMRKRGGKNANRTPNRGQQVSFIAQENLKLAIFLFHHQWSYTFDWEVMGVKEDIEHLLAGQQRLKDKYKTQMCCLRSTRLTWQEQWSALKNTSDHIMVS